MARQVRAGDVAAVAGLLTDAMRTAPGRDWDVRAGDLEWDVERTLEHLAGSLAKYGTVPRAPGFTVVAYVLDAETSRWTPIADPD